MRGPIAAAAVTALLVALTPAAAAEQITYGYDARGRLIKVERAGAVSGGVKTIYAYDAADNRTLVTTSGGGGSSAAAPRVAVIPLGQGYAVIPLPPRP